MTSEQDLYAQAITAVQAGDLGKARELLTQLLKIDRKNVNYWLWMSAAVATSKERIYCLREVLVIDPKNAEALQGLRMLGEKTAGASQPVFPSRPLFVPWKISLELADEHPASARGLRSRVVLYILLGGIIISLAVLGISQATHPVSTPDTSPILRWTVTVLPTATQTNTPSSSSTGVVPFSITLDATLAPTPMYVATPHNRLEAYSAGMRAYEKGDWDQAIDYFNQVLAAEPNDADVYYHLGDIYRFQGSYNDALSAYRSAMKIDPDFAPAYLGEAQIYLYGPETKLTDAQSDLQKAVSLDSNLNQAYLELANLSLKQNDASSALDWLSRLPTTTPVDAETSLLRAKAFLAEGNTTQALASIQTAHAADNSILEVYQVWGEILLAKLDYSDSLQPLLTVLTNDPTNLQAKTLLARAYFETGNTEKAASLVKDILQQNTQFIDAYLLLADIDLVQGNIEDARTHFNAALRIDYNNFDANIGLGRVQLALTLAGSAYNDFEYADKFADTDAQKATVIYWEAMALQGMNENSAAAKKFADALSYANNALPQSLRQDAQKRLESLFTPTPSLTSNPASASFTLAPSDASTSSTPLP